MCRTSAGSRTTSSSQPTTFPPLDPPTMTQSTHTKSSPSCEMQKLLRSPLPRCPWILLPHTATLLDPAPASLLGSKDGSLPSISFSSQAVPVQTSASSLAPRARPAPLLGPLSSSKRLQSRFSRFHRWINPQILHPSPLTLTSLRWTKWMIQTPWQGATARPSCLLFPSSTSTHLTVFYSPTMSSTHRVLLKAW